MGNVAAIFILAGMAGFPLSVVAERQWIAAGGFALAIVGLGLLAASD